MNKTNDTDYNIPDLNIDSEGKSKKQSILCIKIGSVISIILYIMILFS